jgi:hypothetical protein
MCVFASPGKSIPGPAKTACSTLSLARQPHSISPGSHVSVDLPARKSKMVEEGVCFICFRNRRYFARVFYVFPIHSKMCFPCCYFAGATWMADVRTKWDGQGGPRFCPRHFPILSCLGLMDFKGVLCEAFLCRNFCAQCVTQWENKTCRLLPSKLEKAARKTGSIGWLKWIKTRSEHSQIGTLWRMRNIAPARDPKQCGGVKG